ncbi:MAG: hypothetical protein ABIB71_02755 [Candidatus Woesearchaeota archaeon]
MLKQLVAAGALAFGLYSAQAECYEQQEAFTPLPELKASALEGSLNYAQEDCLLLDLVPAEKKLGKERMLLDLLWTLPTAYISTLGFHEFGHYCIMDKLNYRDIEFSLFEGNTIASVKGNYPEGFDISKSRPHPFADLGGVAFSTMANGILTDYLIHDDNMDESMRKAIATTSLMMMLDRFRYVLSSTLKFYAGLDQRNDDINNGLRDMFLEPDYQKLDSYAPHSLSYEGEYYAIVKQDETALDYAYPLMTAATIVETILRWQEISYLVKTALGMDADKPSVPLKFYVNSDIQSLTFNFRYDW